MSPAELKTLRESLGLTAQWLADAVGVRLRTVQYWEAGRQKAPADVAELLRGMDERYERASTEAVRLVQDRMVAMGGPPEVVDLWRYRKAEDLWADRPDMHGLPVTSHAALLARTRRKLLDAGVRAEIRYVDDIAQPGC